MRPHSLLLLVALVAGCASPDAAPLDAASIEPAAPIEVGPTHLEGTTSFSIMGACAPAVEACVAGAPAWDSFDLANATAEGTLTLEWTSPPNLKGVRAYLVHDDASVAQGTGESPLEIGVPALEPGSYEVRVFPDASAGPADLDVAWTYHAG